jgi:hypothetical protein
MLADQKVVGRWMGRWVGAWVDAKPVLWIADSNQKCILCFVENLKNRQFNLKKSEPLRWFYVLNGLNIL